MIAVIASVNCQQSVSEHLCYNKTDSAITKITFILAQTKKPLQAFIWFQLRKCFHFFFWGVFFNIWVNNMFLEKYITAHTNVKFFFFIYKCPESVHFFWIYRAVYSK